MEENVQQWIADYTEGSISREDFRKLEAWIAEKPENRVVFEDYLRLHREAREIGFIDRMDTCLLYTSSSRLDKRCRRHDA